MNATIKRLLVLALVLSTAACYRHTVITGLPESETTIDIPWQKSWVIGLVPPDTINSQQRCPNGVAKVMVEHTFLNGLVRTLTYNIFTPIHPVVTCAR